MEIYSRCIRFCLLLFFLINNINHSFAATQGSLGLTSTGTISVSVTLPGLVQITSLADIAIGTPSDFTTAATGSTTACIYSNNLAPIGGYAITVTSTNGSSGTFKAKNASSSSYLLPYTLTWYDANSTAGSGTALTSGTKSTGHTGGNALLTNCGGSTNAAIGVSFAPSDMQAVPAGSYSDTVTILLETQ